MVDIVREIPGSAALDDALTSSRLNPRRGDAQEAGASARAPDGVGSTNAAPGVTGRARVGASAWPTSRGVEWFDKQRVAQVTELIARHATASRASAGAQWLSMLHASASVAMTSLSRWQDGDPVSQAQARRALDALGAHWQNRERGSLGTVDDRLHFDERGNAPRRFTVDGVAPAQWRASKAEQITLFPAGPHKPGVEIDVANAVSQAGLRRRATRALAAYGITLEPPPPERGWVMSTPGTAWPALASRMAIAQTSQGAGGHAQRVMLREAPDAIAPQTWRLDGADAVAQTRRALASMVRAIRASHVLAQNTARASTQAVGSAALVNDRAAIDDEAFDIALASAKAWTSRLGKQPPFVALTLAMPKGIPVTRANVRALLGAI
ncbi:hypothetical protein PHO31112_00639 [Pandoraea horticolens]|uniref:Uncharacterized protein n=1 Tax=Pandoraea horticolens TaxID=2508298 RepID=A0A5E4SC81_9BURK|nr:hypothetical protein [Pandoraea horticolens]VVD71629.1 hypothetical protein PHO31112_00639 [Pandoraea horticolens]